MTKAELAKVVAAAKCRVFGSSDAAIDSQRYVLALLIQCFDFSESTVLCEPSLARKTTRPPDVVLIDPEVGVHVVEVKGVSLGQIEALEPGGQLRIRYDNGVRARNPITQVRNSMFDIKDATQRAFCGELSLPFRYWVAFPKIRRTEWHGRWGEHCFCPAEFLFLEDLDPATLSKRFGSTHRHSTSSGPIQIHPLDQLECVFRAFGDSSVLYQRPGEREQRRTSEGTLGEAFDESAESYKALSEEQQKLSSQNWEEGPRLVRGCAGSGKTIVLANNCARRIERSLQSGQSLFGPAATPRVLAVCFNRSLVPFIRKKIDIAFQQRTGRSVPEAAVDVFSYNRLMWHLAQKGLWRYQSFEDAADEVRASSYLSDLTHTKKHNPGIFAAAGYDAIYVDEGQDFLEEDFRLLMELCRTGPGSEPNLYVFYDDAQNLYGRSRPNWQSLGLNLRGGRATIMTDCFRNTRPIVEATFNVLYGSCAAVPGQVPTKDFGAVSTLEQKGLIEKQADGFYRIRFAKREGRSPILSLATSLRHEDELIVSRLRWLIEEQQVRPQDIQVLSFARQRVTELANVVRAAKISGLTEVHVPFEEKDRSLGERGRITISTVASAKGYDAYCVLLASANEFPSDVMGRASFYVGCTRAVEYLEVFAHEKKGLAVEMEAVLGRLGK